MKKKNKGFTLVEILAVIVVLGLIMIVALPTYSSIYNSVKLSTYLNTVKTIRSAALDYGSNSYVKDLAKEIHDKSSDNNWCKVVTHDDLIKAGYLKSDSDEVNMITDVFTGASMGYDKYFNASKITSTVSICYCKDDLDIEAFVNKDLDYGQVYHAGEVIRVIDGSSYSFKTLNASFIYDDFVNDAIKASKSNSKKFTVSGIEVPVGTSLDGITDYKKTNTTLVNIINRLIVDNLTKDSTCNR